MCRRTGRCHKGSVENVAIDQGPATQGLHERYEMEFVMNTINPFKFQVEKNKQLNFIDASLARNPPLQMAPFRIYINSAKSAKGVLLNHSDGDFKLI